MEVYTLPNRGPGFSTASKVGLEHQPCLRLHHPTNTILRGRTHQGLFANDTASVNDKAITVVASCFRWETLTGIPPSSAADNP